MAPAQPEVFSQRERSPEKRKENSCRTVSIVLKCLEILCGITCLCLMRSYDLLYAYQSILYLGVISTGGYVLISGVLLLGIFVEKENGLLKEIVFNCLGFVLYFTTGVLTLELYVGVEMNFGTTNVGIVSGVLSFCNACFYLVDTLVALCQDC